MAGDFGGDSGIAKFRFFEAVDIEGSVAPAGGACELSFGGWGFQESEGGLGELLTARK